MMYLWRFVVIRNFQVSYIYSLFNRAFWREQQAVLSGKCLYKREITNLGNNCSLLRRNTHRLEKGLLMRPRRRIFALDYIHETMDFYEGYLAKILNHQLAFNSELAWAHGVLSTYFDVAARHPRIDQLRDRFRTLPKPTSFKGEPVVPYKRDLSVGSPVQYRDLLKLAIRRRSVRWFLSRPVPRDAIADAIRVASLSPSACNRQPFYFRIFDAPADVRRIAALPYGAAGYDYNIPAVAVVIGRLRNYFDERDRHLVYIDGGLAAMGFVYALEVQGLSSCIVNWPDIEEREQKNCPGAASGK